MTYLYEELKAPTRLYIKKCSHCDLKYFGKTVLEDIENYQGSGVRWTRHLRKHEAESVHLWNSDWYYDTSIIRFANKFSVINKIIESKNWANLANENGIQGGNLGKDVIEKASATRKETMNSNEWKSTIGKEFARKIRETKSSLEWKETVGKSAFSIAAETQSRTKSSLEWKESVGVNSKKKELETKNTLVWKETVGKTAIEKFHLTTNDPEWQNTIGEKRKQKLSEIAKNRDRILCPHCLKKVDSSNYARWHGSKCKFIQNEGL